MELTTLPKAELHCHLEGTVSAAMLRATRQARPGFPVDPAILDGVDVHDYDSFWAWWEPVRTVREQPGYLRLALAAYVAELKRQNVRYSEIMVGASDLLKPSDQELLALRAWLTELENGEIQVELLAACGRKRPPELFASREARIIRLYEAGVICGVAIGGPEPGNPVQPFHKTLSAWHEAGLGIEVHAGEWVGPESVWDALTYGHPDRIGHGVTLFEDPALVERFQAEQIHIEMCPTSNLKTGSIARMEDHPIAKARDLGLNFSVNTDDPGPFGCSMVSEYTLLAETFGFTAADFDLIYANSLAARFQPELRIG